MTLDKDKMSFNIFMQRIREKLEDKKKKSEDTLTITLSRDQWQHIVNAYDMLLEEDKHAQQIRVLANKIRFFESNQMSYEKFCALQEKETK